MELRATREMRRNEQMSKTTAKKADTPAKTLAQASARQRADKCDLSRQALAYLEQQNELQRKLDEQQARRQAQLARQNEKSGDLEALEKGLDVLDKCLKISAAIMRGDRVPPEDLKYLMDNDPDGYKLAMALRREKKDPEDMESVLDKEGENQDGSAEGAEGGGEVSAPAASGGSAAE